VHVVHHLSGSESNRFVKTEDKSNTNLHGVSALSLGVGKLDLDSPALPLLPHVTVIFLKK
jgi:hypothetical protein